MSTRSSTFVTGGAALLLAAMLPSQEALSASPTVEAAVKSLATIPSDTEKFQVYCKVLGEMDDVPETDAAKLEALEGQLDDIIASYGSEVAKAWEVASQTEPDSEDGEAITAAFEEIEAKCP